MHDTATMVESGRDTIGMLHIETVEDGIRFAQEGEFEYNEEVLDEDAVEALVDAAEETLAAHREDPNEASERVGVVGDVAYDSDTYSADFLEPDVAFWTNGPHPSDTSMGRGDMDSYFFIEGEYNLQAFLDALTE